MTIPQRTSRLRNYFQFLVAVLYFFLAQSLAARGAVRLANDAWSPLAMQAMFFFLLTLGYAALGFWLEGQLQPVKAQGWPLKPAGGAKPAGDWPWAGARPWPAFCRWRWPEALP